VNLLAFDTSTERLTAAVQPGAQPVIEHEAAGGSQASAGLIPALLDLLARAGLRADTLDAIVFGRGPGSFTGLRTACSVAQGLAFGVGVPVVPVETLLAVAEDARARAGVTRVVAALDARMGEVYWARYAHEDGAWHREGDILLGAPQAMVVPDGWAVAGNALGLLADVLPPGTARVEAAPTAAALLRVAPALVAEGHAVRADEATPLYIRDKVAQTTQERAAARSVLSSPSALP
jgi:tRNA threonylcarbamoyladenosine biosynthesis protein TsaB